jgi:predicted extracellular nuclease
MKKLVAPIHTPGRLALLAAVLAGLMGTAPAFAALADVVVSQVYGAGGNAGAEWKTDFIELFNRSGSAVSLGGMSVQYQSANGTAWQATALPAVTLQPGQYFLVSGAGGANGKEIGAADQAGSLNLSGTTGKVALASVATAMTAADGGGKIVDLVGFGTANRFETAVAPAPSTVNAIHRAALGCTDTDNNASDFSAGPVAGPRRSTSPLNACDTPAVDTIIASCPESVSTQPGSPLDVPLTARDTDSIVNAASITSGAVPGMSLAAFTPAAAAGASASVSLRVSATVPNGSYPVAITFANNHAQSASCTVTVDIAGQLSIPQIQGAGPTSTYANTVRTTQGVITAKVGGGFFLQDPNGDGDPSTSDAIFVFGASTTAVAGDMVRVTGTVTEYRPGGATRTYTELTNTQAVTKLGSGYTIAPTNIEMPNELARFEAMLVRFTTPLTVNQNQYLGERGELVLSYGRREIPTSRHPAGSGEAQALAAANAANIVVLDDGIFTTPPTIPYLAADATVRSGDTVGDLTGVLDFGAMGGGGAAFKLQPTVTPVFSRANPRTPAPELVAGNVKVASANVLNFFTTFTNGGDAWGATGQGCTVGGKKSAANCRGADNMAEFVRQRDKIVAALKAIDADVVGLMEIQNNGDIAAAYLAGQLNAASGTPAYAVVPAPAPAATGTDAIRVAMIYKPAVLRLVGGAMADADSINNRPPMAQAFKAANGATFSLVVNHLKSKGGCSGAGVGDRDIGDGQGCWNATRLQQAARLADVFVPQVAAAAGDPDVLVVGDLNAYGFEDPVNRLTSKDLVNEIERFVRPQSMPYSYIFGGESGYLDHALASTSLDGQVAGVTEWHNNADEPAVIDYNTDAKPQDVYVNNAYRASDHDPVVVSLNLTPTFANVTSSMSIYRSGLALNRNTGQYSGTYAFTNKTGAAINGPFHVELAGLPAGVTLANASGTRNGLPTISANSVSIAPGASVTLATVFNNPSKVGIDYSATVYADSF